jgi:hypothetical protein
VGCWAAGWPTAGARAGCACRWSALLADRVGVANALLAMAFTALLAALLALPLPRDGRSALVAATAPDRGD